MKPIHIIPTLLCCAGSLSAATVSISRCAELEENSSFNIDNYGAADWALWQEPGAVAASNATPTNE